MVPFFASLNPNKDCKSSSLAFPPGDGAMAGDERLDTDTLADIRLRGVRGELGAAPLSDAETETGRASGSNARERDPSDPAAN